MFEKFFKSKVEVETKSKDNISFSEMLTDLNKLLSSLLSELDSTNIYCKIDKLNKQEKEKLSFINDYMIKKAKSLQHNLEMSLSSNENNSYWDYEADVKKESSIIIEHFKYLNRILNDNYKIQ